MVKNSSARRKEIIKIRGEIHEKEMKEVLAKINETKSWFFETINKTDKPLARLIMRKREKNKINKIRNEKREVATGNGEGNCKPLQHSCLENPVDRGALWAAFHGVAESDIIEVP